LIYLATKIIVYITVNSMLCPKAHSYDDMMVVMVMLLVMAMLLVVVMLLVLVMVMLLAVVRMNDYV